MSWADGLVDKVRISNQEDVDVFKLRLATAALLEDDSFTEQEKRAASRLLSFVEKNSMKLGQLRIEDPDLASFYEDQ